MYKPRSRKLDLMTKRSLWGWLFVLPFIVGLLVFIMSPLYTSLMMSFKESTSVSIGAIQETDGLVANSTIITRTALVDKGLANYRRAFMQDTSYITALKNVATGELFYIPAILIFSFIIANVLNQQFVGRGVARAIFFMPVVTSTGATSSMLGNNWAIHQMSNGTSSSTADMGLDIVGMLENTLSEINRLGGFASFITSAFGELSNIISISGVQILIFLAALQTISPALFEASDVEGATKWESFWKITFPMVSPMILVNAMYTMIDVFTGQNNAVISKLFSTTNSTSTTVSQAMAMGWAYFIMVAVIIFAVSGIISKFVYNEND